jgi:hypothetical protein
MIIIFSPLIIPSFRSSLSKISSLGTRTILRFLAQVVGAYIFLASRGRGLTDDTWDVAPVHRITKYLSCVDIREYPL